ncbi:MAG: hypothetical protein ABSA70_14065 [Terriglobia bacterium]
MARLACPYLAAEVDLTAERETHIAEHHPDLLPEHRHRLAETLANPDLVRRSTRLSNVHLFSRWFDTIKSGKHVVVVVLSESTPTARHWVVTAYLARRLAEGGAEWQRN